MLKPKKILIVGAGPTGLAAAIALAKNGHQVLVVDRKMTIDPHSRAIGINARTLELLEPYGVTERLLEVGLPLKQMCVHIADKVVLTMNLSLIPHRFNFMLALPQPQTEYIFTQALAALGVDVQRGVACTGFSDHQNGIHIEFSEKKYNGRFDYLLGADGAHSMVRHCLEEPFAGKAYDVHWQLRDVVLDKPLPDGQGQLFLHSQGQLLVAIPLPNGHIRLIATNADGRSLLPSKYCIMKEVWHSDFTVQCRQVKRYQKGRVFLAGDAAHVHSPAGGRGMNLGIEDGMLFADFLQMDRLSEYSRTRHAVGKRVLMQTDRLFRLFQTTNPMAKFLRNTCIFPVLNRPWVQKLLLRHMARL